MATRSAEENIRTWDRGREGRTKDEGCKGIPTILVTSPNIIRVIKLMFGRAERVKLQMK